MIGPDIPAHLLQNSEPRTDPAEEEEDTSGPYISEGSSRPGPQLPADFSQQEKLEEENEADDDEDDYTPALPPEFVKKPTDIQSKSSSPPRPGSNPSPGPSRRIQGPSFPSHPSRPYLDEDSDEDDVGPRPLPEALRPMHEKDAVTEFMEREERRRKNEELAKQPKALKREEWMLVPPSSSDLLGKLDTTKLKARQFSKSSGPVNRGDNTLWTETPAERQQRIADEVVGKKRRAVDVANEEALGIGTSDHKRSKREEERIRRGVDEYTRVSRGPSLVQQHSSKQKTGDEDDDSEKAIWDHSRDMALGGRLMDDHKRNQLIREAKGLGDRFGSGKGGSFL